MNTFVRAKGLALSDPDSIDQVISFTLTHMHLLYDIKVIRLLLICSVSVKRKGSCKALKDEACQGCKIYGFLDVNKVGGNLHFAQ